MGRWELRVGFAKHEMSILYPREHVRQAVKYASLEIRGEKLALQILYIDGLLKEFMKSIDKRRGSKTESWRFQY